MEHYVTVREEDFERALQIPMQSGRESTRTAPAQSPETYQNTGMHCHADEMMGDTGLEPVTFSV